MVRQVASRVADRLETLDLRKFGKVRKISKVYSYNLVPGPFPKFILLILAINSSEIEIKKFSRMLLFHMKTRVCVKFFVNYCSFSRESISVYCLLFDR